MTRTLRAPRGTQISCKGWQQEAALRMLMNNLDPDVAEKPEDLIVYGGRGRAARNWESFDAIVASLKSLESDETLLVQSGKPVGVFKTADGKHLILAVFITKFWRGFCMAAGEEHLATDPRFAHAQARVDNSAELYPIVEQVVVRKTLSDWLKLLSAGDVPHAPVLSVGEALDQPYVRHRNMVVEATHPKYGPVKMVAPVIKYGGEASAPPTAPPTLGEHSDQVLRSCGYSDTDIARLRASGVIS